MADSGADWTPGIRPIMPNRITFINHATVLIQFGQKAILTDPVYSLSVSYFLPRLKRRNRYEIDLPAIDLVTISHNHYDHLNFRTLRRLRRQHQPAIVVSRGDARYARRLGFDRIHELQWWEEAELDGMKITSVPAAHFTGRTPWSRNRSAAGGFVFQADGKAVYFAGDTASGDFLEDLASRFSLNVALLPIGAYKPHDWFKDIHLNPLTAIDAFQRCNAQYLIPIHWGTFKISDEPMAEPPKLLLEEARRAGIEARVRILDNGEGFDL